MKRKKMEERAHEGRIEKTLDLSWQWIDSSARGGGEAPPDEDAISFHAMVSTFARNSKAQPTRVVKWTEEILEEKLPPTSSRHKALALDD